MGKKINFDEKRIIDMYLNKKMSSYEIGKIFSCSNVTIVNRLKKFNIKRRNSGESRIGKKHKNRYTTEQRKDRSERVRQDYINHPELRETRSKQFKKNIIISKEDGTIDGIILRRVKSYKEGIKSGIKTKHI